MGGDGVRVRGRGQEGGERRRRFREGRRGGCRVRRPRRRRRVKSRRRRRSPRRSEGVGGAIAGGQRRGVARPAAPGRRDGRADRGDGVAGGSRRAHARVEGGGGARDGAVHAPSRGGGGGDLGRKRGRRELDAVVGRYRGRRRRGIPQTQGGPSVRRGEEASHVGRSDEAGGQRALRRRGGGARFGRGRGPRLVRGEDAGDPRRPAHREDPRLALRGSANESRRRRVRRHRQR
mmetsp:Transcript_10972/g.42737  ORF Transcript_10972/g.42737 Transcript_10972/m.42737 type:complete len:233 (+) Transcript_10972:715-1413(+)